MTINECNYQISTKIVEPCDPCIYKRVIVRFPRKINGAIIYVNLHYVFKHCLLGMTDGPFLNAFTLLPCEELELEIIRRSKYTTSYHEERSHESTFSQEFTNTIRHELEKKLSTNFSMNINAGFNIFVADGGVETSMEVEMETINKVFQESVFQTSQTVSESYEISLDYKSEVEHSHRQLRKIKNPNQCKAVTYFFYQLMKKYKTSLSLEKITFDISREIKPIFKNLKSTYSFSKYEADIVSSQLDLIPIVKGANSKDQELKEYKVIKGYSIEVPRETIQVRELQEKLLLVEVKRVPEFQKLADRIKKEIDSIQNDPDYQIGEKWSKESCIKTNSTVVDVKLSECSICPEEYVLPQEEPMEA